MTTAAAQPPETPGPGELDSPRAIRAALLPEERGDFERAYQNALRIAGETLSLDRVFAVLENWRRIARQTLADPAAHRRMLQQAARTIRTWEPPEGAVSWTALKAELGLS